MELRFKPWLNLYINFAPKIKPTTRDRKTKAFTGKLTCSSPSRIQFSCKEAPPPLKALFAKI